MQITVLGMHRSGTSMLARLLALMGCHAGPEEGFAPPDAANPKGYWERRDVWAVDEAILQALGKSWYDVAELDLARLPEEDRPGLEERAQAIVNELDAHRPWVVKDPRLCLVFPFWRRFLERPVCVLIDRDPLSVARSLRVRDGFPLAFGIALWERYTLSALAATLGLPRVAVSCGDLLAHPLATVRRLREELTALGADGLRDPGEAEVMAFVDPALNHHTSDEVQLRGHLNLQQLDLHQAVVSRAALRDQPPPLSQGALDILDSYPRQIAEREALRAKIVADTSVYLKEREARLHGEETITHLLADAEALRTKIAADTLAYDAEREVRLRGEETIAALLTEVEALRAKIAADAVTYQTEREVRLRGEETIVELLKQLEPETP
ncbi:MAG TPA: sulfotransferase [Thermoanaerobaculia bacterium]